MEGLLSTGPTPSSFNKTLKISRFISFFIFLKQLDKVVELVGGASVINGPIPSSLEIKALFLNNKNYIFLVFPKKNQCPLILF